MTSWANINLQDRAWNFRLGNPQIKVLPGGLVLRIFTSWKNPSTSTGFEPVNFGSRGEHSTPRPSSLTSRDANFTTCSHTFTLFWSWKASVIAEVFQVSVCLCSCVLSSRDLLVSFAFPFLFIESSILPTRFETVKRFTLVNAVPRRAVALLFPSYPPETGSRPK